LERLDILRDSIGHPLNSYCRWNLLGASFFEFQASRYITGLNWTSEKKVIVVWIWYELPFSIWSVSIYSGTQSEIWVNSYSRLNLLGASIFNFERLDILRDSIGHSSKKLLLFALGTSFHFEFRASWYITGLNRTSEWKVIVVCICKELLFSISSVSIYYRTQSDIRVKSYCRLNLLRASVFNFEHLDIARDLIGHPSKKLLSFEFDMSFRFQFGASRYIPGLSRKPSKKLLSFEFARIFCFQFRASGYITGHNRTFE